MPLKINKYKQNAYTQSLYLFGGWGDHSLFFYNDVWRVDFDENHRACFHLYRQSTTSPRGRMGHSAVSYRGYMWIFGGTSPGFAYDHLLRFDPRTGHFVTLIVSNPLDVGTQNSSAAASQESRPTTSPTSDKNKNVSHRWTLGRIEGRGGHASAMVGDWMYVIGGNTVDRTFNDVWRINLSELLTDCIDSHHEMVDKGDYSMSLDNVWFKLVDQPAGTGSSPRNPPPVIGQAVVVTGNKIIM
jgi:hypothetical protein